MHLQEGRKKGMAFQRASRRERRITKRGEERWVAANLAEVMTEVMRGRKEEGKQRAGKRTASWKEEGSNLYLYEGAKIGRRKMSTVKMGKMVKDVKERERWEQNQWPLSRNRGPWP